MAKAITHFGTSWKTESVRCRQSEIGGLRDWRRSTWAEPGLVMLTGNSSWQRDRRRTTATAIRWPPLGVRRVSASKPPSSPVASASMSVSNARNS